MSHVDPNSIAHSAALAVSSARVKPETNAAAADATWEEQAVSRAWAVGGWGRRERGRRQSAVASDEWDRRRGRVCMSCATREGRRARGGGRGGLEVEVELGAAAAAVVVDVSKETL